VNGVGDPETVLRNCVGRVASESRAVVTADVSVSMRSADSTDHVLVRSDDLEVAPALSGPGRVVEQDSPRQKAAATGSDRPSTEGVRSWR